MKKIYLTLFVLIIAMMAMAYLYFTRLTAQNMTDNGSLNAAVFNSGLVFCMQDDKNVVELLSGQDYFQRVIGSAHTRQLTLLKNDIIANPTINKIFAGKNIYISFSAGLNKSNNYLISTQLNTDEGKLNLLNLLKANKIQTEGIATEFKLILRDSIIYYGGIKNNLVVISNDKQYASKALNASPDKNSAEFAAYIKSGDKVSKNSLANLYINFNIFPELFSAFSPGKHPDHIDILRKNNSFASLSYNFSKERLFFNGNSRINDKTNYLNLFSSLKPQKITIDNLLPDNTANFTIFSISGYQEWSKTLEAWFIATKQYDKVQKVIASTNQKYHLDVGLIFPKYFKSQLITFQLKSGEKIGAIQLSNGDKLDQLLLDISENYSEDIKLLKEPDLLYAYFGEPFRKFNKPYYTIIDNYMVFSNSSGAVLSFLHHYRKNELLINTADYANLYNQISKDANVMYYGNLKNSLAFARNTMYNADYSYLISRDGLAPFSSVIYQLSGDGGNFQTNLIVNGKAAVKIDSTMVIR